MEVRVKVLMVADGGVEPSARFRLWGCSWVVSGDLALATAPQCRNSAGAAQAVICWVFICFLLLYNTFFAGCQEKNYCMRKKFLRVCRVSGLRLADYSPLAPRVFFGATVDCSTGLRNSSL